MRTAILLEKDARMLLNHKQLLCSNLGLETLENMFMQNFITAPNDLSSLKGSRK
jgi:hypothetical protein